MPFVLTPSRRRRQPLALARRSADFAWDVLINQAEPFYDAARRTRVSPRGALVASRAGQYRNWRGVNALESINAALPTAATGYTVLWVGAFDAPAVPLASVIRTTTGAFRLEAFTSTGGGRITAVHTSVANLNDPGAIAWDFRPDPWTVILTYDGAVATLEVLAGNGTYGVATTTVGMNAGGGTLELSTTTGSLGAYLVGYARRPMPAGLRRRLLDNPWSVFAPDDGRVFYSLGAGPANLVVSNLAHAHLLDGITLTQAHALAVGDAAHAHTVDNVVLTQTGNLAVDGATHAHAADAVVLTQAHQLATADAAHGHAADGVALTQAHNLSPSDTAHAHLVDGLTLVLPGQLDVQSVTHGQTVTTVELSQVHALAVEGALHAHAVDALNLSGAVDLVVNAATHGHVVDAVALAQVHELLVANNVHLHTAEGLTLASGLTLAVADALHAHGAASVTLGQVHALVVSDAVHAQLATHLGLSIPGGSQGPHTIVVRGQTRTIVVIARSRIIRVAPVTVQ